MPRGTLHVEVGWIDLEGREPVLRLEGGGRWRLDGPGGLRRMRGERVVVEGVRDGYDLLAVCAIGTGDPPRVSVADPVSLVAWLLAVAVAVTAVVVTLG